MSKTLKLDNEIFLALKQFQGDNPMFHNEKEAALFLLKDALLKKKYLPQNGENLVDTGADTGIKPDKLNATNDG
ncbi:hypothetical protein [Bartonella tamiae]|uniref:Uncharacterized protein n=1 Tax=Bartonella tamiae Th239 TaxID=1094558 RepID=J1JYZ2_9HYPH|nr:hypothetical protein [Bartonella tamiae]EJF90327.1 hypothetical protein ME5_00728 [Bartonella tamiae Th239]EJF93732.1 hypothetical protein MEG_01156 [Bartonella tamiae Th307]